MHTNVGIQRGLCIFSIKGKNRSVLEGTMTVMECSVFKKQRVVYSLFAA